MSASPNSPPSSGATSKYWTPRVAALEPYVPGEQPKTPDLLKLNTNENPYPPSPRVAEVYSRSAIDDLRLYPDPTSTALRSTIAAYYSAKPSHVGASLTADNVLVGNGSDEVLAHAFVAFFAGRDEPLLSPDIGYSFYPVYCKLYGVTLMPIALNERFEIDPTLYQRPNAGVIVANPNAPTSIAMPRASVEALLRGNPDTVVLVDEAYVDFGAESVVPLVDRYPNLLVVQTLSKSRSLAGARLGFAIGSPELIEGLTRVKDSFNSYPVDRLAEAAGIAAFEDEDYFRQCCAKIVATREWTTAALTELGCQVLPSHANFVMAKPGSASAREVFERLRAANIVVRFFDKPRVGDFLRITIGTDPQMKRLVGALREML